MSVEKLSPSELLKFYTTHRVIYVSKRQYEQAALKIISVYTSRGNLAWMQAKTKAARDQLIHGVHRDNLFPSQDSAWEDKKTYFCKSLSVML